MSAEAAATSLMRLRPGPPRHPQTNGMVERFNGRISDVLATTRFVSGEQLATTIKRYGVLYNQHIPQKALGHKTPLDSLREWQQKQPELFVRNVCKLPGPNNYLVLSAWRAGWVGYAWSRLRCDVYRLWEYKLREIRITGRLPLKRPDGLGNQDPRVPQY